MSAAEAGGGTSARRSWHAVLLVVLVALVFARVARLEFLHWDDHTNIAHNPHVNPPTLAGVAFFWRHAYADLYVPLAYTAWSLLVRATGQPGAGGGAWDVSALPFHVANLALHIGATLLVYRLLVELLRSEWPSFAGALLFAVHPLQVEAVCWASGLRDVMGAMLALAAALAYVKSTEASSPRAWYAVATIAFTASLLSKPSAVVLPLVVFLLCRLLPDRRPARSFASLIPWCAIAIAWTVLTRSVQSTVDAFAPPLWQRPLVAGDALAFYLAKLAWPLDLGIEYGRSPNHVLAHASVYATAAIGLAFVVAIVLARRRLPWLATAGSVFVVGVSPVLGLVSFAYQYYSTVADRYAYLSIVGAALAFAWCLRELPRRIACTISVLVLALLGARAFDQTRYWIDDFAFLRRALDVNPRSFAAYSMLGASYIDRGRTDEAIDAYEHALAIEPADFRTQFSLGVALDRAGRTSEALEHLEESLRHGAESADAHDYLGLVLARSNRPAEALEHFRAAVRVDPLSWSAQFRLGVVLRQVGRPREAATHLREALRLNPGYAPAADELDRALNAREGARGDR
jgi:tetratricopeptide (TPR) repeat protein